MSARLTFLPTLATSLISLACSNPLTDARAKGLEPTCYASPDGETMRSTLLLSPLAGGGERLIGVTELRTGASASTSAGGRMVRAVEEVKLDASGRLIRLEATLGPATGDVETRVVLDATSGRVRISTPSTHVDWSVPSDLPWVWASILRDPATGEPIATPALGRVALRAANPGGAVRLLDLGALTSHAVAADQMVVSEPDRAIVAIVVAADDAIEMENGVPTYLHLAALGTTVEPVDAGNQILALAAGNTGCASLGRFITR